MKLAEKLVTLRKSSGLSQEELAERLNVSRQAVSRWEMGSAMPDAGNLLQLSKLFQVTTDYLLNDDYLSDQDLPKVKEVKEAQYGQLLGYLVALEVMTLVIQFMTTVILENAFFALLSFLPFVALLGGFEYACRKNAGRTTERAEAFRRRFYKVSAWLGLYFPIRFFALALVQLLNGSFSGVIFECCVLSVYMAAALSVTLTIDKSALRERG